MHSREKLRYEVTRRRRRGDSLRSIGRALGVDRRTVSVLLGEINDARAGEETKPTRAPRGSKLEPYHAAIDDLMSRYPDIHTTRILEELQGMGFDGGYTIVREYVLKARPQTKAPPAKRVETAPGKQGQADFSPYKLPDGSSIHAFSVVLSYSRFAHIDFSADERQPTIFRRLAESFEAFGGVPEEVVFDSMSGIVDRWEMSAPILNLRALDFAAHYGFCYHIAPRADGAYKGKVERPFRFLETSFFNGRTMHTLQEARGVLAVWLDKANQRKHRQTRERPVDRLQERERERLGRLPAQPYDTRELAYRIVDGYGHVHFDGNSYGSPKAFAGRRIVVRASETQVELYEERGVKLVQHARAPRGAHQIVVTPGRSAKRRVDTSVLMSVFESWGDEASAFAKEITERERTSRAQLAEILAMQDQYRAEDIVAALAHATRYRAFDARSVARILEAKATPRRLHDRIADAVRTHVRQTMATLPVSQREPDEYARLLGPVSPTTGTETDHGDEEDPTDGPDR